MARNGLDLWKITYVDSAYMRTALAVRRVRARGVTFAHLDTLCLKKGSVLNASLLTMHA